MTIEERLKVLENLLSGDVSRTVDLILGIQENLVESMREYGDKIAVLEGQIKDLQRESNERGR